ncbi:E3 ubiquitin-protein ligase RNF169 [Carcharodon carcharias]|uniref:E3 ubiquitin-protein ligase RNF169 n=1 Tax=Carcharodon carcharias TaxID=13397 RepID=UPI001B7E730F|nr:E3 ubiquitin-protein ligase RNF169 [Carcharodon carcharias]
MAARSGSGERARRGRQGARLQAPAQAGDSGLCRGCLSRVVPKAGIGLSLGLACPLCRRTDSDSSRARAAAAAAPLWQQRGRRRKQQGRRRQKEEAAEQRLEPEPVFRAPLVLSKAGDVREGFENQLRQYEAEKESLKEDDETVTAEIIQIILAEGEQEKQQTEKKKTIVEQMKRDEELARKWSREFATDNMSDSENEEPVKRMTTRQWGSGANNKLSSNTSGRFISMLSGNTEENRSWSTPVENDQNRRPTPRSDSRTKAASVSANSLGTNNVINILASSENSRSNSAPNLSSEKRPPSDTAPSGPGKRERSASPDSNDSISGEFNHFKPIICSPCTPPKKLPDGRVMKPKIVKSTPRNLGCGFHKPTTTTYDVNPNLLEKWGQILQDRHEAKMASKSTLTLEEEDGESMGEDAADRLVTGSEVTGMELAPPSSPRRPGYLDSLSSLRPMDYSESGELPESSLEVSQGSNHFMDSDVESSVAWREDAGQENGPRLDPSGSIPAHTESKHSTGLVSSGSGSKGSSSQPHRGRKRHHKTKHTAVPRIKRAKWNPPGDTSSTNVASPTSLDHRRQEEEDRKVALRLQRRFDLERTTVNRQKGSKDGYTLRTKTNSRAK